MKRNGGTVKEFNMYEIEKMKVSNTYFELEMKNYPTLKRLTQYEG